jgi:glycosyltransferase involved in cell wall biosynthesis
MKIAIDGHTIGSDLGGNVTYITNLFEALATIDSKNEYILYVALDEAVERYRECWPNVIVRQLDVGSSRIARFFYSFRKIIAEDRPDIFFVQFNAPARVDCKIVAEIHDLSFEHVPETFRWHEHPRMRFTTRRTARKADHVITCSEYTRADIIDTYKLAPEKVTAIHLAAASRFAPAAGDDIARIRDRYGLPSEFILAVGSIQPRKNLERLIDAYRLLNQRINAPPLVLVGKKAWLYKDSIAAVERSGCGEKIRLTGFVPEEDLPAIYSAATVFVYPSFFEGFGLPPLEAMQCGTPVITGDRTSLPEIVGSAGVLVDPYDSKALADAIERLLSDRELRTKLTQRGLERSKMFSWEQTARDTLKVFERVVWL